VLSITPTMSQVLRVCLICGVCVCVYVCVCVFSCVLVYIHTHLYDTKVHILFMYLCMRACVSESVCVCARAYVRA